MKLSNCCLFVSDMQPGNLIVKEKRPQEYLLGVTNRD